MAKDNELKRKRKEEQVPHQVKTLAGVQALVQQYGQEEVEVRVGGTIKRLNEAKPMRRKLKEMIRAKFWCVSGMSLMKPMEEISTILHQAQENVSGLLALTAPDADPNLADAERLDLIRDLAKKLRRAGRRLKNADLASVVGLGGDMVEVGKLVRQKRKIKAAMPEVYAELSRLKNHSNDVYNQVVKIRD